jgi:hypothetical protein
LDDYIINRLRADSAHLLILADKESLLQHKGLRGRFRELLIDNILAPWLPPYTSCGTGMIIAAQNAVREATQDDVIVYDRSLTPPVLASSTHAPEGVFLYNSVIARIEVKSTLTRAAIKDFVKASREISALKFTAQGHIGGLTGAVNLLFAYDSDAKNVDDPDYQLRRVIDVVREQGIDPLAGIVSNVCIPPYGFWKLGEAEGTRCWQRLQVDDAASRVAWFVGCISHTCFTAHAQRQGRDPKLGLEGGIGLYLPHPFANLTSI